MSRMTWILWCTIFSLAAQDSGELTEYTSRRPICNSMIVGICGIFQTLQDTICGHRSNTQIINWYERQFPPMHNDTVQWLGHATTFIRTQGYTILTDPVFWNIPAHTRYTPLGTHPGWLPDIDAILISHNHYDHLNKETLKYILETQNREPHVMCPYGVEPIIRECGYQNVTPMAWWETVSLRSHGPSLSISCVPAHHWSGRSPCDINQSLWAGWLINGWYTYYFAGDTAYNENLFRAIRAYSGNIDLAMLPIGPSTPRQFTRNHHMHPDDLIPAVETLNPRRVIPIHWGTFKLGPEKPEKPIYRARDVCIIDRKVDHVLCRLTVGATYKLRNMNRYDMPTHRADFSLPLRSRRL